MRRHHALSTESHACSVCCQHSSSEHNLPTHPFTLQIVLSYRLIHLTRVVIILGVIPDESVSMWEGLSLVVVPLFGKVFLVL